MIGAFVTFLAAVGALTVALVSVVAGWYIYTRRPTPNATVREAVTSVDYGCAFGFFIAPPTLAGVLEGAPLLGFSFGAGFVGYVIALQWWFGPL